MNDFNYRDAQDYLRLAKIASFDHRLGLAAEQCVHPAMPGLVYWLWLGSRHVGTVSISRRSDKRDVFLASKMRDGQPYLTIRPATFSEAIRYAGTDAHDQSHKPDDWHPRADLTIPEDVA